MKCLFLLFAALPFLAIAVACRGGDERDDSAATPDSTASPAGPTVPARVTPGTTRGELRHDGLARTYRLFVPDGLDSAKPVPMVVGLHGGLGSGEQFAANSRFERAAEEYGFIAVFPDGVGRTWNGGNCCGQAVRDGIDDVGFLAALIDDLAARLPVDRERVFMTGHSNGAIMSFRFGCERADIVAGIAPLAGSLEIARCEPSRGVPLLSIHGDADQNHPLEGGQGPRSIAGVEFVSQARSLEVWTTGMECSTGPGTESSGPATVTTWRGCRDGTEARLMVVHGADHPWPGGVGSLPATQSRTSDAIDATIMVTQFFLSH